MKKALKQTVTLLISQVVIVEIFPIAALAAFRIEEATIADIQAAISSGDISCREITQKYLDRIEAYDQQGPTLNSILAVNPNALTIAAQLDTEFQTSGFRGSLHCVPAVLKDTYSTVDMPTTYGSLSLAGSTPLENAFQVDRLQEAGAIILAKTNLSEFGIGTGIETFSSLGGQTVNPYGLDYYPGGSSGGTAVAIAANFAVIGMGVDTSGSTRYPSAYNNLFGIRPTIGLSSRSGIIPLSFTQDIGAPMMRTVTDLAKVLDVTVGYDPEDPITARSIGNIPESYTDYLDSNGLTGARIGIVRELFGSTPESAIGNALIDTAIQDLRLLGADIVDGVSIANLETIQSYPSLSTYEFKFGLNNYLSGLGSNAPYKTLEEIINSGKYAPNIRETLEEREAIESLNDPTYLRILEERTQLTQQSILKSFNEYDLDALLYPTLTVTPPLIGQLPSTSVVNGFLSVYSGFPAISIPSGFTSEGLPFGFDLLGREWSEPELIKFAYSFEQATQHRRAPASVPELSYVSVPEPSSGLILVIFKVVVISLWVKARFNLNGLTIGYKYDPLNPSSNKQPNSDRFSLNKGSQ